MQLSKLLGRRTPDRLSAAGGDTSPAQPRLVLAGGQLRGTVPWPHDPFFRPSIGVFVGHELRAVVPTVRRPAGRAGDPAAWPCMFELPLSRLGKDVEPAGLRAICLETGMALRIQGIGSTQPGAAQECMSVDELISLAEARRQPWDCTGFRSFLDLSLTDQIDLTYRDVLGRGPDPEAWKTSRRSLGQGELTILDVRDQMLASDEFIASRSGAVVNRLGHWLVWGGLRDIVETLVPGPLAATGESMAADAEPGSRFVGGLEALSPAGLGSYLARLACGNGAPAETIARWQRDHAQEVSQVVRQVTERTAARAGLAREAPGRMTFSGLLGTLRTGTAGRRADGRIHARPGIEGHVAFGPYVRLRAGAYRLALQFHAEQPRGDAAAVMWLEVNYGDVLIARLDVADRDFGRAMLPLDFTLSAEDASRLRDAAFEFRVWTNGVGQLELIGLTLDRLGPPGEAAPEQDWLPMLKPGGAGQRVPAGMSGRADKTGHVFYGPYRALLPGSYLIAVECTAASGLDVVLEALANGKVLARRKFTLMPGSSRIEMIFDVTGNPTDMSSLHPLEFRLDKQDRGDLTVSRVAISPVPGQTRQGHH